MTKLKDILEKVHGKVHGLRNKKMYSEPKIYTGGVDVSLWSTLSEDQKKAALKKSWYVYYSCRDPYTGNLKRQKNLKGGANYYKTKKERLEVLKMVKQQLLEVLELGYNPYDVTEETENKTVAEAFEYAIKLKVNDMSKTSYKKFTSRINKFENYLYKHGYKDRFITSVDKKIVVKYLNHVASTSSNRNRNNDRTAISSLFAKLKANELIKENFIADIEVLKAPPKRNKTYSKELLSDLYTYIAKEDKRLLLYIQFVSYNFLRPIEVNRLKVGDINIKSRSLKVWVKQGKYKEKIIPEILFKELPDLSIYDKDDYLFTPSGTPGDWEAAENNRRDYFTKEFKKIKDHFNLGAEYGIYSFRHTHITKLYRELRKTLSPFEVKSKLMLITGHSSMAALEKYLRDLDVELAEDYSELFK
jgi:integrase